MRIGTTLDEQNNDRHRGGRVLCNRKRAARAYAVYGAVQCCTVHFGLICNNYAVHASTSTSTSTTTTTSPAVRTRLQGNKYRIAHMHGCMRIEIYTNYCSADEVRDFFVTHGITLAIIYTTLLFVG